MQVDVGERTTVAFSQFVTEVEPRLRRALVALRGAEAGRDATAEALAWAWEHWP
jgi:DNA-directed RNA polymerase specialized sigma24 family protein